MRSSSLAWEELVASRLGWFCQPLGFVSLKGNLFKWERYFITCPRNPFFQQLRYRSFRHHLCYELPNLSSATGNLNNKSPQQYWVTCSRDLCSPVFKSVLLCTEPCKYAKYFGQAVVNERERNFTLKETSKEATIKYKIKLLLFLTLSWRSYMSQLFAGNRTYDNLVLGATGQLRHPNICISDWQAN